MSSWKVSQKDSISNRNQGGGNKKQGLPPSAATSFNLFTFGKRAGPSTAGRASERTGRVVRFRMFE